MAIAVANSWENGDVTASSVTATVSGFSAGELAVVFAFGFDTDTGSTMIITDNSSGGAQSWTKRAESTQGATFRSWCAVYDVVLAGNMPTTISIAASGLPSIPLGIVVARCTGNHATPHDVSGAKTQTADDPTAPSITTTDANDVHFVALTHDGADTSIAVPSGYTLLQDLQSNANVCYLVGYKVLSATGAQAPAFVTGASRDYGMVAAAYKPAAGAAATVKQLAALGVG